MTRMTDELLMAYADDALPHEQRAEVQAYLQNDELARARVENLRRSAEFLRQAYDAPMHEPPPQRLIDAIERAPANVTALNPPTKRAPRPLLPVALAASLAMLAVLIGARLGVEIQTDQELLAMTTGPLTRDDALSIALESVASGTARSIGEQPAQASAQPMLTFLDGQNRPCREMEVHQADATVVDLLIACRTPDATWSVEGVYRMSAGAGGSDGNTGFKPASGAANGAVDELLERIGAGDPLAPADEQRLLDSGWQ